MSEAMVDSWVCSTLVREKGPGTKSREEGSEGGGGL